MNKEDSYQRGKEYLESKLTHGGTRHSHLHSVKGSTCDIMAEKYDVGRKTIQRAGQFAKCVDSILDVFEYDSVKKDVKKIIFSRQLSMKDIIPISKMSPKDKKESIMDFINTGSKESFNYVYFIKSENNLVKIGKTCDINDRFHNLKNASPCKLYLLGYQRGSGKKEKELHKRFEKYHHHGEWFELSEEILKYIEKQDPVDIKILRI